MLNTKNLDFNARPTTYNEVKAALNKIGSDCSAGHNNIPINLLKPVSEKIISPLTYTINGFLDCAKFPREWEIARYLKLKLLQRRQGVQYQNNTCSFRSVSFSNLSSTLKDCTTQLITWISKIQVNTDLPTGTLLKKNAPAELLNIISSLDYRISHQPKTLCSNQ